MLNTVATDVSRR